MLRSEIKEDKFYQQIVMLKRFMPAKHSNVNELQQLLQDISSQYLLLDKSNSDEFADLLESQFLSWLEEVYVYEGEHSEIEHDILQFVCVMVQNVKQNRNRSLLFNNNTIQSIICSTVRQIALDENIAGYCLSFLESYNTNMAAMFDSQQPLNGTLIERLYRYVIDRLQDGCVGETENVILEIVKQVSEHDKSTKYIVPIKAALFKYMHGQLGQMYLEQCDIKECIISIITQVNYLSSITQELGVSAEELNGEVSLVSVQLEELLSCTNYCHETSRQSAYLFYLNVLLYNFKQSSPELSQINTEVERLLEKSIKYSNFTLAQEMIMYCLQAHRALINEDLFARALKLVTSQEDNVTWSYMYVLLYAKKQLFSEQNFNDLVGSVIGQVEESLRRLQDQIAQEHIRQYENSHGGIIMGLINRSRFEVSEDPKEYTKFRKLLSKIDEGEELNINDMYVLFNTVQEDVNNYITDQSMVEILEHFIK